MNLRFIQVYNKRALLYFNLKFKCNKIKFINNQMKFYKNNINNNNKFSKIKVYLYLNSLKKKILFSIFNKKKNINYLKNIIFEPKKVRY